MTKIIEMTLEEFTDLLDKRTLFPRMHEILVQYEDGKWKAYEVTDFKKNNDESLPILTEYGLRIKND